MVELLRKLTEASGVSGNEDECAYYKERSHLWQIRYI